MFKILWNIRCFFYDKMMKENKKHPCICTTKSKLYCKISGIFWKLTYKITPLDEWNSKKFHKK